MKRKHTSILFLLFAMIVNAQQTYKVSTAEETQNVLLEEFTGVNCSFCPMGHEIAAELSNGLRDQLCIVNLHAGPFSPHQKGRNLTTEDGDSLYEYYKPNDYPCALINRHEFEGDGNLIGRDGWFFLVNKLKHQTAKVNLHLESQFNGDDRTLTIHVEGYNVADNSASDLKLYVLITQDYLNIKQMGVPDPDSYVHMNVLSDYITPYDGEAVAENKQGGYFTADYTYSVPEDVNDQHINPGNMKVLAYVTSDGMNEVLNVVSGKPQFNNYKVDAKAELSAPAIPAENSYGFNFLEGEVRNMCTEHITSATFEVNVNGEIYTSEAECDIAPFTTGSVNVPCHYKYGADGKVLYRLTLTAINGLSVDPTSFSGEFTQPATTAKNVKVEILTDRSNEENEYCVKDEDGKVIRKFGPYAPKKSAVYEENLTLEEGKTYCVEVTDIFGNGIYSGKTGTITVLDENGKTVNSIESIKGFGARVFFKINDPLGIDTITAGEGSDGRTYTIGGIAVDADSTGGIIIRNGKKYLNKR